MNVINSLYPTVHDLTEAEYAPHGFCSQYICSGGVDFSFMDLLGRDDMPMNGDESLGGREQRTNGVRRSRSQGTPLASTRLTTEAVDARNDYDEAVDNRQMSFDDCYVLTRHVHKGVVSVIWECVHRATGLRYAVKVVDRRRLNPRGEQAVYREVQNLDLIDYKTPGTIHLHEFFNEPNYFYIVTEYAPGGSLLARIVRQKNLSEEDTKRIVRSILETLKVQHRNGSVHRNLKPDNILLNGQSAMIADYGLATQFMYTDTGERLMLTERCGTSAYVAPEILQKRPYDTQVDMWGVGIIAYMSLAGYPPFADEDKQVLFSMISKAAYTFNPQDWASISRSAKRFISSLLHVDPGVRMTAEEALEHPWLVAHVPPVTPEIETVATLIPPVTVKPAKNGKKLHRVLGKLLGSRTKELGDKATAVDKCDEQSTTSYSTSILSSDVAGRR